MDQFGKLAEADVLDLMHFGAEGQEGEGHGFPLVRGFGEFVEGGVMIMVQYVESLYGLQAGLIGELEVLGTLLDEPQNLQFVVHWGFVQR